MPNELEQLNYDVGVDRVLDILQIVQKNGEFIARHKRKEEEKAAKDTVKVAPQEEKENPESLEDLAKVMITSGRFLSADQMKRVSEESKADGKVPEIILEGIQKAIQVCAYEKYLEDWRPTVVVQEEITQEQIETQIRNMILKREAENIIRNQEIQKHQLDRLLKNSKRDTENLERQPLKPECKTKKACNSSSCLEAGLHLCSGCRLVAYCSEACSREDWRCHRRACREESQRRGEGQTEVD